MHFFLSQKLYSVRIPSTHSPSTQYAHAIAHSHPLKEEKDKKRCSVVVQKYEGTRVSRRDNLATLDLADARVVVVLDEPVDGVLEALFERDELELFVVLARLAHEPQQLFVRRRLAELPVRLARVELHIYLRVRAVPSSPMAAGTHLDFARKAERLDDLLRDVADAHVVVLADGKDDRLDVVVLAQLPYEHLCEVVREHELAQRLPRPRDDERRAVL